MQEPPSTSPTPTTRSDLDFGDDENITLNAPPAKRKAGQSPASLPRPPKIARFNVSDQTERRAPPSSGERTNIPVGYLTQAPKVAKKIRPSFSSQPVSVPPPPNGKGKNRASSRQSTSSLSDHISNIVEKHNMRFRRLETARKTVRKRRVTTSGLIREAQRSSGKFSYLFILSLCTNKPVVCPGGSEISPAATRVRRGQPYDMPTCSTP